MNTFAVMWVITKIRVKCCSLSRHLLSNLLLLHLELEPDSALNLILRERVRVRSSSCFIYIKTRSMLSIIYNRWVQDIGTNQFCRCHNGVI